LGQGELSRFRARGIRVSTFLCSLRTYPAVAQGCCLGALGRFGEGIKKGDDGLRRRCREFKEGQAPRLAGSASGGKGGAGGLSTRPFTGS
jgi:hypothetical protein